MPYPEQFRRETVELVRGGRSILLVAESLGVPHQTIRRWVKQVQLDQRERDDGLTSTQLEELRDRRRRIRRLERDRETVRRAAALRAIGPEPR